jgi:hypothetical protein
VSDENPARAEQAIAARMSLIVGANNFDRLFRGICFDEFEGGVLYAYAADEYRAAEIEDTLSLHIAIIASGILKLDVQNVMVFPASLRQQESDV